VTNAEARAGRGARAGGGRGPLREDRACAALRRPGVGRGEHQGDLRKRPAAKEVDMETWLLWVVSGFGLVIAELLTGTFYLLVIALGFFAAARCAWLGANCIVQAVVGQRRGAGRRLARAPLARVPAREGRGQVQPARPRPAGGAREAGPTRARASRACATAARRGTRASRARERGGDRRRSTSRGRRGSTLVVAAAPPAEIGSRPSPG
jgi:hypothetical protein